MTDVASNMNRRDMLKAAGAAAVGVMGASLPGGNAFGATAPKKVLVFLKVCDLPAVSNAGAAIAQIETQIIALGQANGFDATVTTDGSVLTAGKIAAYDFVIFYTTGNPSRVAGLNGKPITSAGQDALLSALVAGKALIAIHCGLRSSTADPAAAITPVNPFAKILSDLEDVASAFPRFWAGQPSGLYVSDPKVKALGGTVGKTPLPLRVVSVQWQDGADIKTRRPILTLLFASTSQLLKNVLQYAK